MDDPACMVCTPALCVHGEQSITVEEVYQASIEEKLIDARKELELERACHRNTKQQLGQVKLELETAVKASRSAWDGLAAFEAEVLHAYRRSKKLTGHKPRPRKVVVTP